MKGTLLACFGVVCLSGVLAAQAEGIRKLEDRIGSLEDEVADLAERGVPEAGASESHFLLTGFYAAGYHDAEGEPGSFMAGFSPVLLWQPAERVFFESELELGLEDTETEVGIEYAQLCVLVNDYMTVGAGKFLNPGNVFLERYHPTWVNKLPDRPLGLSGESGGILADAQLGVEVRGAVPAGDSRVTYAIYVSNGPSLVTDDPETAGSLSFDNYEDANDGKAVGGRIAWFPIDALEIGVAGERAAVTPSESDTAHENATIGAVDVNYVDDVAGGRVTLLGQWVLTDLGSVDIDPNGTNGVGPLPFDDRSEAEYVELAYRPTGSSSPLLQDLEGVVRYDRLNAPDGAPYAVDEHRWTIGIDYWLGARTVFKIAYRFDTSADPDAEANAILVQLASGL